MIVSYIGKNASGKTLLLYKKAGELSENHVSTDMTRLQLSAISLDEKRVERLAEFEIYDINVTGRNIVSFSCEQNIEFCEGFYSMINLLCKDVENIFIDEPEKFMSGSEVCFFCEIVKDFVEIFGVDVYMTTHDRGVAFLGDVYAVRNKELCQPTKGDFDDLI